MIKQTNVIFHTIGFAVFQILHIFFLNACDDFEYADIDEMNSTPVAQRVQIGFSGRTLLDNVGKSFFEFDFNSPVADTTGALYCNEYETNGTTVKTGAGNTVRATCGLTFVSPKYAITAAHCVDENSCGAPGRTFKVRTFDISTLDVDTNLEAFAVDVGGNNPADTFENGWRQKKYFTEQDGYKVTFEDDCHVEILCGYGDTNNHLCQVDGVKFEDDIALIHCPNRPINAPDIEVAKSINEGDELHVHWFHEVIDVPIYKEYECNTSQGDLEYERCVGFAQHYAKKSDKALNFHYIGYAAHRETQLMPLTTIPWQTPNGEKLPTILGKWNRSIKSENVTINDVGFKADVWGCHGTSGSGAFISDNAGKQYLAGVAETQGQDGKSLVTRLCIAVDAEKGQDLLHFNSIGYIRPLARWALSHDFKDEYIVPIQSVLL